MKKNHKFSMMVAGPCFKRTCMANGPRCGEGFCVSCCYAFHEHVHPSLTGHSPNARMRDGKIVVDSSNTSNTSSPASPPSSPPISTAIQPTPAPAPEPYAVGEIRLVLSQDINTLRR